MPELSRFQRSFAAAIARPAAHRERMPTPLQIYRNTALLGAVGALCDNFPVTRAIVGERSFNALAVAYARTLPPDSPVLAHYGAQFPEWLEGQAASRRLPYIGDVARCDRLWVEALHAGDGAALTLEDVGRFDGVELLTLRLRLHPATRCGWHASAAIMVWLAHRDGRVGSLEPDWRPAGVLFTRSSVNVETMRIDAASHRLLCGIRMGETLGNAAAAASSLYPETDIGSCFAGLVRQGAFASLSQQRTLP